jgi:hypothetical protein
MPRLPLLTALGLLTLLTFHFPGHTYLLSDTQIYVPMFEHMRDPSLLANDIVATSPHTAFTIYDELTLFLARATGLDFEPVLKFQQVVTRFLGVWGFYLTGTAAGLTAGPALLAAAAVSLGATIVGPAVLSFEYEPVPRGFAVCLMYAAIGLIGHRRYLAAGTAGAFAFLYHPPTAVPLWFACSLMVFAGEDRRARWRGFLPLAAAAVLLAAIAAPQSGLNERQALLTRLDGFQFEMQRIRASYNFVSRWGSTWLPHYGVLWVVALAGVWRLRTAVPGPLRVVLLAMPAWAAIAVPATYLLYEHWQWGMLGQFQPARALLFVTVIAALVAAIAGCRAAAERRWVEAFVWFLPVYWIPAHVRITTLPPIERLVLILAFAGLATLATVLRGRWTSAVLVAAILFPVFLIPGAGGIVNYRQVETPELGALASWAAADTPKDAVFLFADNGRALDPGIFRARGRRALYVDWKSGGQVNYFRRFAAEWWGRWRIANEPPFAPDQLPRYASHGIDYIVVKPENRIAGLSPAFENSRYLAYQLTRNPD